MIHPEIYSLCAVVIYAAGIMHGAYLNQSAAKRAVRDAIAALPRRRRAERLARKEVPNDHVQQA